MAPAAMTWDIYTFEPVGATESSLIVTGGRPMILYTDAARNLRLVRAADAEGASWYPSVVISPDSGQGSLAIVSGHPAVAYAYDSFRSRLRYARADDPDGFRWTSAVELDTPTSGIPSLAVIDGRPAVSYATGRVFYEALAYVFSFDPVGDAWSDPIYLGDGYGADATSLAEVAGRPAIAWDPWGVRYIRADDSAGTSWGAPVVVSNVGRLGSAMRIVDGNPAMAIVEGGGLAFQRALDGEGASWGSSALIDPAGGAVASLAIIQGNPAIGYSTGLTGTAEIRYVRSLDPVGAGWGIPETIDAPWVLGPSLTEVAGEPALSYGESFNAIALRYAFGGDLPLTIAPLLLPDGREGRSYLERLRANGGTEPYTFDVSAGALPPGLSLSSAGTLSGVPTSPGNHRFTVTATDSLGDPGSRDYEVVVSTSDLDFLVGEGLAPANPNRVRVFDDSANPTVVDFHAYGAGSWGVNVASGDIDADGFEEILTGPGPGPVFGPQVRAFTPAGVPLNGASFFAYGTPRFGTNVGAGRLETDKSREILTGAGAGAVFGPHVRGWSYLSSGQVTPIPGVNYFAYQTLKYGAAVGASDVDEDGYAEILSGPGPGAVFGAQVRVWQFDDVLISLFPGGSFNAHASTYGVWVAGGDLDNDGAGDIATAPGPGPANSAVFKGFAYEQLQGMALLPGCQVTPAATTYGGRVGLGHVVDSIAADLLAGLGPDPTATSAVRSYYYAPLNQNLGAGPSFVAFPGQAFGAVISGGALGY